MPSNGQFTHNSTPSNPVDGDRTMMSHVYTICKSHPAYVNPTTTSEIAPKSEAWWRSNQNLPNFI